MIQKTSASTGITGPVDITGPEVHTFMSRKGWLAQHKLFGRRVATGPASDKASTAVSNDITDPDRSLCKQYYVKTTNTSPQQTASVCRTCKQSQGTGNHRSNAFDSADCTSNMQVILKVADYKLGQIYLVEGCSRIGMSRRGLLWNTH